MGCNYLSLPLIPASGTQVLIWQLQFEFNRKLPFLKFYKSKIMALKFFTCLFLFWQLCCHGKCWYMHWKDNQGLNYSTMPIHGMWIMLNTLRLRQNGRRFADDTFKRIFLNENVRISNKISLKFVPKGPINNNPALVQIMAWRQPGDKPLSEPMMVSLLMHTMRHSASMN